MFNFTSLLGAQSASPASQSLLEFDGGIKVLIDAGWDETFDPAKLREIEKLVPTLSFVLLTHATTAHLGAFAHCCKHFPLFTRIPVYATTPVINLGRTLLQDLYASTPLASTVIPQDALNESAYSFPSSRDGSSPHILLQAPTVDEIASYFGLITQLKYSQPHQPLPSPFSPPLGGLTITAYSAGHTLGGTIWHIQHNMESVVYAVDWNQAREHVLSGAAWLGVPGTGGSEVLEQLRRPTALICSSKGAGMVTIGGQRHKRDDALLSMIRETVANGGSVLVPSDSSARILELAYLLEETWQKESSRVAGDSPLKSAKIYLASRTGGETMRYVRSMLEWMEEGIVKEFETATGNAETQNLRHSRGQRGHDKMDEDKIAKAPFDFRHITLLERRSQVNRMLGSNEPRVILASDTSLEWGFSRDAVKVLASDPRNLVILTERAGEKDRKEKGLGRYLWELWNERNTSSDQDTSSTAIIGGAGSEATIQSAQQIALEGNELQLYQQYLARQRALQNTIQGDTAAALETSADVVDDRSSSTSTTSEDSDIEHQGKALNTATTLQHARHKLGLSDAELGINILIRRPNVFDYQVQYKKGREKSFPYVAKRRRADDMGELIRPEEFVRADERDEGELDGGNMAETAGNNENAVGMKRKWDDLALRPTDGNRGRVTNGPGKRRRPDARGGPNAPDKGAIDEDMESSSESESEDESEKIEGPSKVVLRTETLQLNCRISFVDYSGLHDRRAIQMLVPLIKPRKLIFVAGESAETNELADECRKLLNTGSEDATTVDVFAAVVGTMIDASVDTNAWTVKLSRDFVRKLQWQNVRGLGVVAITGLLRPATDFDLPIRQGTSKKAKLTDSSSSTLVASSSEPSDQPAPQSQDKQDATPILDVLPANLASATRSIAQPFHVGDLRLADLRKMMQNSGMTAEFRGEGVLVINGSVAIRKSATGRIEIDGGAYGFADPRERDGNAGTFFKVRKLIYGMLAVVGGGNS